ncbi:MAG: WecB/TagA/CpsF family glycosyltransferase [archaeon]
MKKQIVFTKKTPEEIMRSNKNGILNFQNLYSIYLFNHEPIFQKAITSPNNFIFPDGKTISLFLRIKQIRGPSFTKNFFEKKLSNNQKHFFIGPSERDLKILIKKFPKLKNSQTHNPPYIKEIIFPKKEEKTILNKLKKIKPKYIWICIGNPKQEILANQLYKKYPTFYFTVGAAMDFLLEKKKESPTIFRRLGVEWAYRLITDFKYSWKKVWKSFVALKYLKQIKKI